MTDAGTSHEQRDSVRAGDRRPGPVTLAELTAGLIWPTLLRSPALAVQPPRVLVGLFTVAALALVAWLFDSALGLFGSEPLAAPVLEQVTLGLDSAAERLLALDLVASATALADAVFGVAVRASGERPVAAAALLLLLAPAWMVGGGAIARMVGVDVAGRMNMSTADALSFSLRNTLSLSGAMLIPIVLMGALALALKLAGWALLSVTVIDLIGGVAYGLMIVVGLALVLVIVGFAGGQALLAPAVAVEGGDAMDAVQRAYAYVIGRPGRAMLYGVFALVQGAIVFVIARWIVAAALGITDRLATAWLGADRARALLGYGDEASRPIAGWLIGEWHSLLWAVLTGFVVSLYFTSSTIVYMLLRRVNDEQDLREVWMEPQRGA
jgi:hypothetical protein